MKASSSGDYEISLTEPAGGEVVEQLPDRGQVLFDSRFAGGSANVGGDGNGLDVRQFELAFVAPVEELFDRARVGHMRVAVADAAVKNSIKLWLARSPRARIIAGSASRPARTSAGGGTI